jgi:hypothetical protein
MSAKEAPGPGRTRLAARLGVGPAQSSTDGSAFASAKWPRLEAARPSATATARSKLSEIAGRAEAAGKAAQYALPRARRSIFYRDESDSSRDFTGPLRHGRACPGHPRRAPGKDRRKRSGGVLPKQPCEAVSLLRLNRVDGRDKPITAVRHGMCFHAACSMTKGARCVRR